MYKVANQYTPYLTRAAAILGGIIALSLLLYGIFLLEAVAHTASRAQAESQIHKSTLALATLQQQYLVLTKEITENKAQELGFVVPKNVTTVFAMSDAHPLSLVTR
jgi:glucose uptake protein GlcU